MTSLQAHFEHQFALTKARITPINKLIQEYNSTKSELDEIKSKCSSIDRERSLLEKELTHYKSTANLLSPEMLAKAQESEKKINELQSELLGFHKNRADSAIEVVSLGKKVKKMETAAASKDKKISELTDLYNKQKTDNLLAKDSIEKKTKAIKDCSDEINVQNQTIRSLEKAKYQLDVDYTSAVDQVLKYKKVQAEKLDGETEHFMKVKNLENDNEKLKAIIQNCNCSRLLFGFETLNLSNFEIPLPGIKKKGSIKGQSPTAGSIGLPLSGPGQSAAKGRVPSGGSPSSLGPAIDANIGVSGLLNNKVPSKLKFTKLEDSDVHAMALYNGQLALGLANSLVKCQMTKNDRKICTFTDSTAQVNSLEYSTDGQLLLNASNDFACCIWRTENKRLFSRLTGHVGKVLAARFINTQYDNFQIISGSKDRTMRLWELDRASHNFKCLRTFMTASMCQDVAVVNNYQIISGYYDNTIRLHDTRFGRETFKSPKLDGKIASIQTDLASGSDVYFSTSAGSVHKFDIRQQQVVDTFEHEDLNISSENGMKICFNGSSGLLAVGSMGRGSTFIFDTKSSNTGSGLELIKRFDCGDVPLSYCWDDEEGRLYCGMKNKKFGVFQ